MLELWKDLRSCQVNPGCTALEHVRQPMEEKRKHQV